MKRSRADTPSPKLRQAPSTKATKRGKQPGAKASSSTRPKSAAAAGEKVHTHGATGEKSPAPAVAAEAEAAAAAQEEWEEAGWALSGWWAEEELLLGWFPFEDGDFLPGGDNRSAWCDDFHDIWHLQHIHEIPTPSTNS